MKNSLGSLVDPVPNPTILTFRYFPLISGGVFPLNKGYVVDLLDLISSNANFSI